MSVTIQWAAFFQVFAVSLLGAGVVVTFYAIGLRLLVRSGRAPVVTPAEFTDAITIISEKEARRATKAAEKAARKNPLTPRQQRIALVGAYGCFVVCAAAAVAGILILLLKF